MTSIHGPVENRGMLFWLEEPRIVRLREEVLAIVAQIGSRLHVAQESLRIGGLDGCLVTEPDEDGGVHAGRDEDAKHDHRTDREPDDPDG